MLTLSEPDRIRIAFDDHRLVSNAGLLLPVTFAQHLGLRELVGNHVDLGDAPGRANAREPLNKNGGDFSGSYRGVLRKYPGFRGRFSGCSALPVRSGGAVAGFDRPVGAPRPSLGPLRPHQPVS